MYCKRFWKYPETSDDSDSETITDTEAELSPLELGEFEVNTPVEPTNLQEFFDGEVEMHPSNAILTSTPVEPSTRQESNSTKQFYECLNILLQRPEFPSNELKFLLFLTILKRKCVKDLAEEEELINFENKLLAILDRQGNSQS